MFKVYIVDDEPLARDELSYLLSQSSQIEVVGVADDLQEIIEGNLLGSIDCLFLDIELCEHNGIELAKSLNQYEQRPCVVFATAYDHYALEAFEVNAIDYLLKPFGQDRVQQTIEKIERYYSARQHIAKKVQLKAPKGKIAVSNEDRIALLKLQDILYFTSEEGKTIVVTQDKKYVSAEPLSALEARLGEEGFTRVHRAYLINLEHLQELEPWSTSKYNVILANNHSVPVSRMYIKDIRKLFEM